MDDVYQDQQHVMDSKEHLYVLILKIIIILLFSNDCHDNSCSLCLIEPLDDVAVFVGSDIQDFSYFCELDHMSEILYFHNKAI